MAAGTLYTYVYENWRPSKPFIAAQYSRAQVPVLSTPPHLQKQKPQAEWKEEEKSAAPAPEEETDECEQVLAAEPKAKDRFAHLPKSTFVLDEFKCKYSKEDTLSVVLPYV